MTYEKSHSYNNVGVENCNRFLIFTKQLTPFWEKLGGPPKLLPRILQSFLQNELVVIVLHSRLSAALTASQHRWRRYRAGVNPVKRSWRYCVECDYCLHMGLLYGSSALSLNLSLSVCVCVCVCV